MAASRAFASAAAASGGSAGPIFSRSSHLCGLYSTEEGQVGQALQFLAGGFSPQTVSFLVGTPETRSRILAGLEREHRDVAVAVAEGHLVLSDYARNAPAQLDWWETRIELAVRRGATLVRAIGDAGAFAEAASREELLHYETEYDQRISLRFPVITMCQYDVRLFSGLVVLDALKSHPHSLGQSAERILA
jgi:hypothetical protein